MDGRQRTQQRRGVRINFNKESGRRHDRKEQGEKGVIMVIRKTSMEDLEQVLLLYQEARQFMQDHGNPHQWGQFYPPREIVEQDIRREEVFLAPSILLWKQIWITEGFMRENGRERGPMGLCTG